MKKNKIIIFSLIAFLLICVFFAFNNNRQLDNNEIILGDKIKGDVNNNGKIDSQDYVLIRKHIMGQSKLSGDKLKTADVNDDGKINTSDYVSIKKTLTSVKPQSQVKPTSEPLSRSGESSDSSQSSSSLAYTDSNAVVIDSPNSYSMIVYNYNVTDKKYGADPTGKSDSTKAIQKALNDASVSKSYSTVYIPKGRYVITDKLIVGQYTSLIGELKEGTTDGTILEIHHGAGSTNAEKAAIKIEKLASIQNIAFWYPGQIINNYDMAVEYPPTIASSSDLSNPSDFITLENLNFVNSYIAMDLHISSAQTIRRIYGTPLHTGIINDRNLDTIKMDNINFSVNYWLNSGLPNVPTKNLRNVISKSGTTAIIIEKCDWAFLANINIDGYFTGIKLKYSEDIDPETGSSYGGSEGAIYRSNITNCYYPIYVDKARSWSITHSKISTKNSSGAHGIHLSEKYDYDITINNSVISSIHNGTDAIYQKNGQRSISISSSTINGNIYKDTKKGVSRLTIEGSNLNGTGHDNYSVGGGIAISENATTRKAIKPKSKNIIMIKGKANSDITNEIKSDIGKLKETGGIVYIPRGVYSVSETIEVPSGIEIRGAISWQHHSSATLSTIITPTPEYTGGPLFRLNGGTGNISYGTGINGIAISQPNNANTENALTKYPYVIEGKGKNVYVVNVMLSTLWNGIHLSGCNNHYIESITGSVYNEGIRVDGKSENGIIRDCHFQTGTMLYNAFPHAKKQAFTKQKTYVIGESTNQVLFNTFVFGPGTGYQFENASNVYAVDIGADFSSVGIQLSKKTTGQIINPMMVIKPWDRLNNYGGNITGNDYGNDPNNIHYIETASDYTGSVSIFNPLNSGSNYSPAFVFKGGGDLKVSGGIIQNAKGPAIITQGGGQQIIGMIIGCLGSSDLPQNGVCPAPINNQYSGMIQVNKGTGALALVGNLCLNGNSCIDGLINYAGINITNKDCPLIK